MNLIAAECAVKKHHPEWSNVSLVPHQTPGPIVSYSHLEIGLQYHFYPVDDAFAPGALGERCSHGTILR